MDPASSVSIVRFEDLPISEQLAHLGRSNPNQLKFGVSSDGIFILGEIYKTAKECLTTLSKFSNIAMSGESFECPIERSPRKLKNVQFVVFTKYI